MKLLLDTHLLVWAMGEPSRLGPALRELLEDPQHTLWFSVVSLWELVIKAGLAREGFQVQPSLLRRKLLHRDPFDRLLLAQAEREGLMLITADALLARYPGPVRHQGSF